MVVKYHKLAAFLFFVKFDMPIQANGIFFCFAFNYVMIDGNEWAYIT